MASVGPLDVFSFPEKRTKVGTWIDGLCGPVYACIAELTARTTPGSTTKLQHDASPGPSEAEQHKAHSLRAEEAVGFEGNRFSSCLYLVTVCSHMVHSTIAPSAPQQATQACVPQHPAVPSIQSHLHLPRRSLLVLIYLTIPCFSHKHCVPPSARRRGSSTRQAPSRTPRPRDVSSKAGE